MTSPPIAPPAELSLSSVGRRRGFLAVCASFLLPGLGHALFGRYRRGLLWFAAVLMMSAVGLLCTASPLPFVGVALSLLLVLLSIALIVDAYRIARRTPRPRLERPSVLYPLALGCLLIATFTAPILLQSEVKPAKRYLFETFVQTNPSMSPTIERGDYLVCSKILPCRRWSIVVVRVPLRPNAPPQAKVLRVVGLPGETVQISLVGRILIDNQFIPMPEGLPRYIGTDPTRIFPGGTGHPLHLGTGEYYLLGDSFPFAYDSRWWPAIPGHQPGAVPQADIVGTVTAIYWPPKRIHSFR